MNWPPRSLVWIGVADTDSEGDVLTVLIATPIGNVEVMAEIEVVDRLLILRGAHIQSAAAPNSIGISNLRALADPILERIDCDEARVEGAVRTTGANPGHRPRVLRFTRSAGTAPG